MLKLRNAKFYMRHYVPCFHGSRIFTSFIIFFTVAVFGVLLVGVCVYMGKDDEGAYLQFQDRNYETIEIETEKAGQRGRDGLGADVELLLPPFNSNITAKDAVWQSVGGTRFKFFLYSAFYDTRSGSSIRVIGATKRLGPDRVWCRFWYPTGSGNKTVVSSYSVAADIEIIREHHFLPYSACFLLCPLPQNMTVPTSVSVVAELLQPPSNLLNILVLNKTAPRGDFAVCVKPLFSEFNELLPMLEFLELYSILGVQHFTFYNRSIGPDVSCILKKYQERGIVTLLPWELNMKSGEEIHVEGIAASLNDCLYRNMYHYSYLVMVDSDELIIPRRNGTLLDLINFIKGHPVSGWQQLLINTEKTGSYAFRNAFFYLNWTDDPISKSLDPRLVTLRKTQRRTYLQRHGYRSKYICRPELIVEAGNHYVWSFLPGYKTLYVSPDTAFIHHYRKFECKDVNDCIKMDRTFDRTVFRYKEILLRRLEKRWRELNQTCLLSQGSNSFP